MTWPLSISFAIRRCAVRLAMSGCPVRSSASVNPFSDARMLFSKSVVDDIAVLAPFEVQAAQFWRSLSNCAIVGS